MKISLKIQWEKSKHYIGGFFGLSINHRLSRAGSVELIFLVVSSFRGTIRLEFILW